MASRDSVSYFIDTAITAGNCFAQVRQGLGHCEDLVTTKCVREQLPRLLNSNGLDVRSDQLRVIVRVPLTKLIVDVLHRGIETADQFYHHPHPVVVPHELQTQQLPARTVMLPQLRQGSPW